MYKTKISEQNKVVVVTKDEMSQDLYRSLSKRNLDPIYIGCVIDSIVNLPDKMTVRAKCHPEDIFDSNTGRQIAKDKFKVKYKAQCVKNIDKMINKLKWYIEELEHFKKRYQD